MTPTDPSMPEQLERYRGKFNRLAGTRSNTGECWLWSGAKNAGGYGLIYVNGRMVRAHRLAWELYRGPIPDGMQIDHRCRARPCVNPEHLRTVTLVQNVLENSIGPTAVNAQKTACPRGHQLTKRSDGHRTCLSCDAERHRIRRAGHGTQINQRRRELYARAK